MRKALEDRCFGYEFEGAEYALIFEKENLGYPRFINRQSGKFYLDPSPFKKNTRNEYFVIENCPIPPVDKLIEVNVRESVPLYSVDQATKEATKFICKIVKEWHFVDPITIIRTRLTKLGDLLEFLAMPFTNAYSLEDLTYCLAMYLASSPQFTDLEKGGINTVVLGREHVSNKWSGFKRIVSVIPPELRRTSARNYYRNCEDAEVIKPTTPTEVSLAYCNIPTIPIHIPLPFNVKYKAYNSFKENFEHSLPMISAFILNTLLFKPDIPAELNGKLENAMYTILDDVIYETELSYCQDIGAAVPKIATSVARLSFNNDITSIDLAKGMELWGSLFEQAKRNINTQLPLDLLYKDLNDDERRLYGEIKDLVDRDIPSTIPNLLKCTTVPAWRFEDALDSLKIKGYTYYKFDGTIGALKY